VHTDLEGLLEEMQSGRQVELPELEQAYTSACAEILELEADAVRTKRRLAELREQLRHVRTAIEWLQEEREKRSAAQ
jgi:chromosome segregation ATPase